MSAKSRKPAEPERFPRMSKKRTRYSEELIERICLETYKIRLDDDSPGNVARMLEKEDGAAKMQRYAMQLKGIVTAAMTVLDIPSDVPGNDVNQG